MTHTTITAGLVAPAVVPLTDGPTIAVNASLGNDFRVTIGASRTVANPTGGVDGQRITIVVTQGGSGGNTLTWGNEYNFGAAGAPTLSKFADQVDVIGFIYNAAMIRWLCVGAALGF
jgi:hypothetical protein